MEKTDFQFWYVTSLTMTAWGFTLFLFGLDKSGFINNLIASVFVIAGIVIVVVFLVFSFLFANRLRKL